MNNLGVFNTQRRVRIPPRALHLFRISFIPNQSHNALAKISQAATISLSHRKIGPHRGHSQSWLCASCNNLTDSPRTPNHITSSLPPGNLSLPAKTWPRLLRRCRIDIKSRAPNSKPATFVSFGNNLNVPVIVADIISFPDWRGCES